MADRSHRHQQHGIDLLSRKLDGQRQRLPDRFGIGHVAAHEDAADLVLDLADVFADVDIATNADSLTLSVQNNTNGTLVTTMLVGTMLTLDFLDDQNGAADLTIRATDLAGAMVDDTFTVTVDPINGKRFQTVKCRRFGLRECDLIAVGPVDRRV